jgi:hypothetical protein
MKQIMHFSDAVDSRTMDAIMKISVVFRYLSKVHTQCKKPHFISPQMHRKKLESWLFHQLSIHPISCETLRAKLELLWYHEKLVNKPERKSSLQCTCTPDYALVDRS